MAIVIKEIHVKTIVENKSKSGGITEEELLQFKKKILKEFTAIQQRKSNWEKER